MNEQETVEYVAGQYNIPNRVALVALIHTRWNIKQALDMLNSETFMGICFRESREFDL